MEDTLHTRRRRPSTSSIVALAVVTMAALALVATPGSEDTAVWRLWIRRTEQFGVRTAFRVIGDYPPGAIVALRLAHPLAPGTTTAVKLSLAACLLATAVVLYVWFRDLGAATVGIAALALNGLGLAALDLLFAPWLLLALMFLQRRRLAWFSVCYALACTFKWQPLLIAPFFAVYLIRAIGVETTRDTARRWAAAILPGAAVLGATAALFGPTAMVHSLKRATLNEQLSGQGLNLGWIATGFMDGVSWLHGRVAFTDSSMAPSWITITLRLLFLALIAVVVFAFWRGSRSFGQLLVASISGLLVYVMANLGVHENHLFLACLLAVPALWIVPGFRRELVVVIVMANVNLFAFYGPGVEDWTRTVAGIDVTVPLAMLFVATTAVLLMRFVPFLHCRTAET